MAQLEIKKSPEGKVLARRRDGQPLTDQDREEAKKLAEQAPPCEVCGAIMEETRDIFGRFWWACWSCAKTI